MKPARILLVNSGRLLPQYKGMSPPVGLLYLAAQVRQALDVTVAVIDQRGYDLPTSEVILRAVDFNPDIIGMRCLTTDAGHLLELAKGLRATFPKALLLAGGPHASTQPDALIREAPLDAVVRGEGELSFEMIVRAHLEGGGFDHIPGLFWRDETGEIIENDGVAPIVEELDSLPMPAYDLLDPGIYWRSKNMSARLRRKYLSLYTSRGCPYQCNYCHSIFGKRFRAHSPGRIIEEVKWLNKLHGVLDFDILDDCFNFDKKRVLEFSELVQKTGLRTRFVFPNALRTDILTQEVVDALADAGTYMSAFALESGSPRIQKMIGKNLNIDRYLAGVEMAVKRGIFASGFSMLGFPGESIEEMRTTIDVACRSMLHVMFFFVVIPFPGTALYREVLEKDPAKLDSIVFQSRDYMHSLGSNLSQATDEQLLALVREAYMRFHLSPRHFFRILRDHPSPMELLMWAPSVLSLIVKRKMP